MSVGGIGMDREFDCMHGENPLPKSNCTGMTVHDVELLTEWIPMEARNLRIQEVVFHFVALQDIVYLAVGEEL